MKTLQEQIASDKGWFESIADEVVVTMGIVSGDDEGSKKAVKSVKTAGEKYSLKYKELCSKYRQVIAASSDDDKKKEWQDRLEEVKEDYKKIYTGVQSFILKYDDKPAPQVPVAPVVVGNQQQQLATGGVVTTYDKATFNQILQPEILTEDYKPTEFRRWTEAFESFYNSSGLQNEQHVVQKQVLLNLMDRKLQSTVREVFEDDMPIFGEGGCIDKLQAVFLDANPLIVRKFDFFDLKQQSGQNWAEYFRLVKAMAIEAELKPCCADETITFKLMTGTIDQQIKKRCLRLGDAATMPGSGDVEDAAKKILSERRSTRGMEKIKEAANRLNNASKNKKEDRGKKVGKCHNCNNVGHFAKDCRKPVSCRTCNKPGHMARDCYSKGRTQSTSPRRGGRSPSPGGAHRGRSKARRAKSSKREQQDVEMEDVSQRYVKGKQTPYIACTFTSECGKEFRCKAVPDTGATKTIIRKDILQRNGIAFIKRWDLKLSTASGQDMLVEGYVNLNCMTQHGVQTDVQALVVQGADDDILLAWDDLRGLKYIPENFPYPIYVRDDHRQWCRALYSGQLEGGGDLLKAEIATAKAGILSSFSDVLSDSFDGSVMDCAPMEIHLRDDTKIYPLHVSTARKIPLHFEDAADEFLKELIRDGVIESVDRPTQWCSPGHFVPKPGSKKVRLVTDFTQLNKYVKRPVHPFPTGQDIMMSLKPDSKFFAKCDLVHGFFHVPLDEESRDLTTFLLPQGRFRYCRGPMGLNATGDIFCRETDNALQGVACKKLVDDIMIEAPTLADLVSRVTDVLLRCRKHGIRVSLRKFTLGTEIPFAGFIISGEGVKPDPEMTTAIRAFPCPKNLTDVRSFLGLAQQLGHLLPDLAQATVSIRQLLKKDVAFVWGEAQQVEFDKVKEMLCSTQIVKPFDPALQTRVLTDASRLYGLGYALIQQEAENTQIRLVRCGSCSLTDTQSRYATIELEALAIQHALTKCSYYLLGCGHFEVITDHKPLLGIWAKPLADVHNSRLLKVRERLTDFSFVLKWTPGKVHYIADALSRYPVFGPQAEEPEEAAEQARLVAVKREDPSMKHIFECAKGREYKCLVTALRQGQWPKTLPDTHVARHFADVWERLSLLDGNKNTLVLLDGERVVVPKGARADIIKILKRAHAGLAKTKLRAAMSYYWPHMNAHIKQACENCSACIQMLPSKPHKPKSGGTPVSEIQPMEEVGIDLFYFGCEWIIMVDRYSSYFMVEKLGKTTTEAVIKVLKRWFTAYGWPRAVRTDGGPQFRTEFTDWCVKHNISHEKASAYHHESNGLAEAGVKNAKSLLEKCRLSGEEFEPALQDWLITPRADTGFSPAFMFFGRTPRGRLPYVHKRQCLQDAETAREDNMSCAEHTAPQFAVGEAVVGQNMKTRRWSMQGTVTEVRDNGQSFMVDFGGAHGKKLRNARFLRTAGAGATGELGINSPAKSEFDNSCADKLMEPRRSQRIAQKKRVSFKL